MRMRKTHWGFWGLHCRSCSARRRKHSTVESQPPCNRRRFRKSSCERVGAGRSGADSETATRICGTRGPRDPLATLTE